MVDLCRNSLLAHDRRGAQKPMTAVVTTALFARQIRLLGPWIHLLKTTTPLETCIGVPKLLRVMMSLLSPNGTSHPEVPQLRAGIRTMNLLDGLGIMMRIGLVGWLLREKARRNLYLPTRIRSHRPRLLPPRLFMARKSLMDRLLAITRNPTRYEYPTPRTSPIARPPPTRKKAAS